MSEGFESFAHQAQAAELPVLIDAGEWLDSEPVAPDQILMDVFDVKDKLAIIGSSKMRKSFFLLQLLLCVAAGRAFLNWTVQQARRVLYVQYEIQPLHCHRRVRRMGRALGLTAEDLGGRLKILNARGLKPALTGLSGVDTFAKIADVYHPELIAIDPLYKISTGVENASEDAKIILQAFDELAEQTSAGVAYTHHDAKGFSGDRDIRDRGAGSNVIGRDYDACVTLTPHVEESYVAVVETLLRNYPPQEPFSAVWGKNDELGGYRWETDISIVPTKKTSGNGKVSGLPAMPVYLPAAEKLVQDGPKPMGVFRDALRAATGISRDRAYGFCNWVISGTGPAMDTYDDRSKGSHVKLIGLTADIRRLKETSKGRDNGH